MRRFRNSRWSSTPCVVAGGALVVTLCTASPSRASSDCITGSVELCGLLGMAALGLASGGPSFSGALWVPDVGLSSQPGGLLRVGVLAGLPLQPEVTVGVSVTGLPLAAIGVRFLPFAWWGDGTIVRGGAEATSIGAVGGVGVVGAPLGGYLGLAAETSVSRMLSFVGEVIVPMNEKAIGPVNLTLGVKFSFPELRETLRRR